VSVENRRNEMLWIVGKALGEPDSWEFQGVFDSEEQAVAACVLEEMFVGPAKLNTPLPLDKEGWPGAYYPAFRQVAFGKHRDCK
jgi:hypothetical protein